MKLPELQDLNLSSGEKVLVRVDVDVSLGQEQSAKNIKQRELYRLEALEPTLLYLAEKNCEAVLMGHRGRPGGVKDESLSLSPVSKILENILQKKWGKDKAGKLKMHLMENLRFDPGEEQNSEDYAKHLAENGNVYINEAFANSHREHASIVALPEFMRSKGQKVAAGRRFAAEVENLGRVRSNPARPLVVVLGGVKEDKALLLFPLAETADKVLVAGRLPEFVPENAEVRVDMRFEFAKLLPDKEDVTVRSIEVFETEITKAKTIVVAGPAGKFEDEGHRMGTERILAAAAANKQAEKIACGGDTISALQLLGLTNGFDWLSVGGGAALEFLTKGTLPGIEALL